MTAGFFGVIVVLIASMALSGASEASRHVAPGVVWIAVSFATLLAVARTWQKEREDGAFRQLLLLPLPRAAVFAGKAAGIWLFVSIIQIVVLATVALVFSLDVERLGGSWALLAMLGAPGLASVATLFGAVTVQTRARELVFVGVVLPLIVPSLLVATAAMRELALGASFSEVHDHILLLLAFDIVMCAGGLSLFGPVVDP